MNVLDPIDYLIMDEDYETLSHLLTETQLSITSCHRDGMTMQEIAAKFSMPTWKVGHERERVRKLVKKWYKKCG
jgi:hypothetical protein